ncbi:lisH domain-containing protein ARMC9-like [Actinia tenebrosa]|uniref:LisH domain-containing protein ARMC9 n=1 Tax=Actinia tenebrosa TaxID=6105 RepID=A0A6P8JC80_ACTTE|nr:lisH domain-containing protein ARMC9-like [Actinia tenebrosa]
MASTCQKLEFNLHIYFAVYPITNGRHNKLELERSMRVFKSYLENKGSGLSQTTEFLPFYALPFVPDPTTHPSFKPIFTNSWSLELRSKLESFLASVLKSQEKPKLFTLYKNGPDVLEKERKRHNDQLRLLQSQLSEVERRSALYFKKFSKIQGDYHKLIGIAAELVDSLEDCVRGKMVTPEYLQGICMRLFSNATHESIDVTKPGTASSMLRASFAIDQQNSKDEEQVPSTVSLDFDKIKSDLTSLPEQRLAFLLQALRWRLTRTTNDEVRDASVTAYIIHDLLGLTASHDNKDGVLDLLNHHSDTVRQYAARLLNALASFSAGRTYFTQDFDLVYALHASLMAEPKTSLISENVLGTLQKLSLRRKLQTVMIKKGLIQWLVNLLDDHDSLSDYTLEYSVALLMNLCLRSSGKRTCIPNSAHVLKVLSDLLGHENQEIRPYVNGALYSILALPAIKEEARAMGMESILECFLVDENPDMKRQIQFIIKQLNTENPMATNDPESDDEDEDDDDDEGDVVDIELDKQEILQPQNGELTGEELLTTEYAMGRSPTKPNKMKNKLTTELGPDHPLTRPTTPRLRATDSIQSVQDFSKRPETSTVRPISSQERPATSSGNRPTSRPTSKPSSRPSSRPVSNQSQNSTQKESDKNVQALESRQSHRSETAGSSLKDPFVSRPKIPRDLSEQPLKAKSSSTPPLGRSMSPTRSSSKLNRPGSGSSSRKGSESGRPSKNSR